MRHILLAFALITQNPFSLEFPDLVIIKTLFDQTLGVGETFTVDAQLWRHVGNGEFWSTTNATEEFTMTCWGGQLRVDDIYADATQTRIKEYKIFCLKARQAKKIKKAF